MAITVVVNSLFPKIVIIYVNDMLLMCYNMLIGWNTVHKLDFLASHTCKPSKFVF